MIGKRISLNIHYRAQLLVGLALSIWLYFFLVLVGPFDAAELPIRIRTILMLGYGLIFFLSYAFIIPIQNKLFYYSGNWKIGFEVAIITLFCLCCLPVTFAYYKTDIVNGDFDFSKFFSTVYLPTMAILMPVIIVGRHIAARHGKIEDSTLDKKELVTLLGDNKLDILKLPLTNLVALEAANNYVTVYYLLDGKLEKKLLRSSLRKIHSAVPDLIQVHRSYIVNSHHFIEWKDGLTLGLTKLAVPVSQKYKSSLLEMSEFRT